MKQFILTLLVIVVVSSSVKNVYDVTVTNVFQEHAEILAQRLVSFGLQDGPDRLRAIENVLHAIGIDLGKGLIVAVQTNVLNIKEKIVCPIV